MLEDREIDKTIPVPLYYQLKMLIKNEMENGSYPSGAMIPTENEISEMFDISRTTVRQAITELVREGYLYRVKSKGTFVAQPKVGFDIMKTTYVVQLKEQYRDVHTELLERRTADFPKSVQKMEEATDTRAVYIKRRRSADGSYIMYVETFLSYDKFSDVMDIEFKDHDTLSKIREGDERKRVFRMVRRIEAVLADRDQAQLLEIEYGSALQKMTTYRYNEKNELLEVSYAYYRGDSNYIEIVENNVPEEQR